MEELYLVFGIIISISLLLIFNPLPKRIIIKYPTLDNIDNTVYKDDTGICYKYVNHRIDCIDNNVNLINDKYIIN